MFMKKYVRFYLLCHLLILSTLLYSQPKKSGYFGADPDPCAFNEAQALELYKILGDGWGYTYDSLLADLGKWKTSPFVTIDSIGASVQNRTIWRLTITDTTIATNPRTRISIHTRTHPSEVQATWVTNEIIHILTDSTDLARTLRHHCIFNIVPMYNPDGIELGYARTNANNVDLERDWDTEIMQPEAAALKQTFVSYMASESPVRIALNMHSAGNCTRYFVYHHETGTSEPFAGQQRDFIGSVRDYWPEGIENWDFFVSWFNDTPTHYPESWFWLNYQEDVMALTYEDMNCAEAGQYDKTASVLLGGIKDYLGLQASSVRQTVYQELKYNNETISLNAYPNPLTAGSKLNISLRLHRNAGYDLSVYNILGQKVKTIQQASGINGDLNFSASLKSLSAGMYYLVLRSELGYKTIPLILMP